MRVGKPLDETTRSQMESLLGHDLKEVRVHDSRQADRLARRLGGEAFTVGSQVFGPSEKLSAGTAQSLGLLAHEITHVIQQTKPDELNVGMSQERPLAPPDIGQRTHRTVAASSSERHSSYGPSGKGGGRLCGPLVQRQEEECVAQRAEQAAIQATQAGGHITESERELANVDPEVLADMIYDMMRQDLVLERERGF